jgi:hypothetical protein
MCFTTFGTPFRIPTVSSKWQRTHSSGVQMRLAGLWNMDGSLTVIASSAIYVNDVHSWQQKAYDDSPSS